MASRTGLRIHDGDGAPSSQYVGHPHVSTEANSEGEVDGKQSLANSCFHVQITQEDEKWLAPDMEAVTPTLLRPSGEHF